MGNAISRKLGEAAWRLRAVRFVAWAAWALALSLFLLLIWRALAWSHPAWPQGSPLVVVGAALLVAALAALLSWHDRHRVARELDRRARTKDRFVSLLEVPADLPASPLIERDVERFSESLSLRGLFRPALPVAPLAVALIAVAGLATMAYFHQQRTDSLTKERTAAETLLKKAEAVLRQSETPPPPEVQRELDKAWEQVADSTQPKREAFRAISELEKKLAAAAQAATLSAEDRQALAQALAGEHARLSQALSQGANDDAASQAAALDPEALAKALEEAAKHRENSRLRELTRPSAQETQQSLVQVLSAPSNARKLQQALREAKAGNDSQNSEQPQQVAAGGLPADAPPGQEKSQGSDSEQSPQGGDPGSELDQGKGDDLQQENDRTAEATSQDDTLNSVTGQGPSRVAASGLSGDGAGDTQRPLQNIDRAAISAALQEINRENIPPGSQILVRRYFESIRPKE